MSRRNSTKDIAKAIRKQVVVFWEFEKGLSKSELEPLNVNKGLNVMSG